MGVARTFTEAEQDDIVERYRRGEKMTHIALATDTSLHLVRRVLRERGIESRPAVPRGGPFTDEQRAKIVRLYQAGADLNEVAGAIHARHTRVREVLVEARVPIRPASFSRKFSEAAESAIATEYAQGASTLGLSKKYGCTRSLVVEILHRQGVSPRHGMRRVVDETLATEMRRLWDAGQSQSAIAETLHVGQVTVSRTLRAAGVDLESRSPKRLSRKGGRWTGKDGYVRVLVDRTDPIASEMAGDNAYIMEHRLVMAHHLGRPLKRHESVHHINGIRAENRIDNLQVRQGKHGVGVVYRCACCGSTDIISVPIDEATGIGADHA